jgi:hypothetical protein
LHMHTWGSAKPVKIRTEPNSVRNFKHGRVRMRIETDAVFGLTRAVRFE